MEVARSCVERVRVRRTGIGGTQDIAMLGTALMAIWLVADIVALINWRYNK